MMSGDGELQIEGLTLAELLTVAEQTHRRLIDHLAYDLEPKGRALAELRETDGEAISASGEFTEKFMTQWCACCQAMLQRVDDILEGR